MDLDLILPINTSVNKEYLENIYVEQAIYSNCIIYLKDYQINCV